MSIPEPKVVGPMNCFIMYRCDTIPKISEQYPMLSSREVSGIVAKKWKEESEDVKDFYRKKASEEKTRHKLLYPDYKRKCKKSKRKLDSQPSDASSYKMTFDPNYDESFAEYQSRMNLFLKNSSEGNQAAATDNSMPLYTFDSIDAFSEIYSMSSGFAWSDAVGSDVMDRRSSIASMPLFAEEEFSRRDSRRYSSISDALGPSADSQEIPQHRRYSTISLMADADDGQSAVSFPTEGYLPSPTSSFLSSHLDDPLCSLKMRSKRRHSAVEASLTSYQRSNPGIVRRSRTSSLSSPLSASGETFYANPDLTIQEESFASSMEGSPTSHIHDFSSALGPLFNDFLLMDKTL